MLLPESFVHHPVLESRGLSPRAQRYPISQRKCARCVAPAVTLDCPISSPESPQMQTSREFVSVLLDTRNPSRLSQLASLANAHKPQDKPPTCQGRMTEGCRVCVCVKFSKYVSILNCRVKRDGAVRAQGVAANHLVTIGKPARPADGKVTTNKTICSAASKGA
jgi:hypothetical protein